MAGTASPATSYLLVEHCGPWARRAFEDSPLDPTAGAAIADRARALGARPLFIRRHGRRDDHEQRFAFVDLASRTIGWQPYDRLADVAAADWQTDEPLDDPIYLVCTHGRHDRCCAIAGRPVAAQLEELAPGRSFECSHLGGDRFAGNVLVLPAGLYYGFVDPLDVPSIIDATRRGEVHVPQLRGTVTEPPAAQAARIQARRDLGRVGIEDLPVLETVATAPGRWRVRLGDGGDTVTVEVEQHRTEDQRATCGNLQPVAMREFRARVVSG